MIKFGRNIVYTCALIVQDSHYIVKKHMQELLPPATNFFNKC